MEIPRHKTAIRRGDFSRPVRSALRDGLIVPTSTVFDYGCGHGQDDLLAAQGIVCNGWDPAFRPDAPKHPADVVNLGFVLNVIEDVDERALALRKAWELARGLLIVSAQVKEARRGIASSPFGDGVLTGRGTFQKFFGQGELKAFLGFRCVRRRRWCRRVDVRERRFAASRSPDASQAGSARRWWVGRGPIEIAEHPFGAQLGAIDGDDAEPFGRGELHARVNHAMRLVHDTAPTLGRTGPDRNGTSHETPP
jgi:hypothetical protein